jgi:hypothetical protein
VVKTLKIIQNLIENVAGYAWDGTCLAVATTQSTTPYLDMSFDDWYDACAEYGFEFIDSEAKGKNEYGGTLCFFLGDFVNKMLMGHRTSRYCKNQRGH